MHDDGPLTFAPPQQFPPKRAEAVDMNRNGNNSSVYDVSSPASTRKRSLSRSEEHGGTNDDASLRSVPVLYTNMVPEGEDMVSNPSQVDVSRKVSLKRSPSKLVKRRSTKGKQPEGPASGSVRGNGVETKRSASRSSQRSFRSIRGPVFEMVTAPPNATINDAGGAFGTGAVMAAPENEVEDELQSGFQERVTIAESALTRRQTIKIQKEECTLSYLIFRLIFRHLRATGAVAVSKQISKIVESEGRSEKNSLKAAIGELKGIQKMQQVAVKVFHSFVEPFVGLKNFPPTTQEETVVHTSHIKSLQRYHEADIAVIKAKAELEKVEADIAARLAKVQTQLNKLRVKAQAKIDKAVADAEKAKADVRARENHRDASRRHSEQMTDWVRDKRKEVEVLRGWMAVDNVGVSLFLFTRLADAKVFTERTRS